MPAITSPELEAVQEHPHYVEKHLSVNPKEVVYTGILDGTYERDSTSGGLVALGYGSGDGDLSDVETDMLVEVGTTPGASNVGKVRIRKDPTASVLHIDEVARGDLPFGVGQYFTVYNLFLPDVKKIRLVGRKKNGSPFFNDFTEYHNYDVAYTDENLRIEPKANITEQNEDPEYQRLPIKFAGWVDGYSTPFEEEYRTVTLSGASSFSIASGAATSVTYLWDVKDGTITVGTSASEDITIQFSAGFRYVTLTVTDSLGTSSIRRVPIWVHDDDYPPVSVMTAGGKERGFLITSDVTDAGRSMTFDIIGEPDNATPSEIPEGTEVCYWEFADFAGSGVPVTYRHTYVGWTLSETTQIQQNGTFTLETGGIAAWLDKLIGFGTQINEVSSTPNKWYEMQGITPDRIVHYLLREYTTCIPMLNLYFVNIEKDIQAETAKRASVWKQCEEVLQANMCFIKADTGNSLFIKKHPSYLLPDDPEPDETVQLTVDDWPEQNGITIAQRQFNPIGRVDGTGAYWTPGSAEPEVLASRAPGKTIGKGEGSDSTPFQRLQGNKDDAQAELNIITGHHYARKNVATPNLNVNLLGNYDFFEPAWMEVVTLLYTGDNIRGYGFTGAENFLVTRVNITHSEERGSFRKTVRLQLEPVTAGEPGETIIIPKGDWMDVPFWDLYWDVNPLLPDFDFDIDFDSSLEYEYENEIIGFAVAPVSSQYVARSFTFGHESVSWDNITPLPSSTENQILRGIACQFNGTNVICRAIYTLGSLGYVYLTTNAESAAPTWSLEETFSISGGTFNGAMTIQASDDPTQDTWAVSWLAQSGVYEIRRSAGSWTSPSVVNSAAFTDATWEDNDVGLWIHNNNVYCGGRVANNTYGLYTAVGTGSWSRIGTYEFPSSIGDISSNLDGDVYASSYGEAESITSSNVNLNDTAVNNILISAKTTEPEDMILYIGDGTETNNLQNPQQIEQIWYPASIPTSVDALSLEIDFEWRESWNSSFDLGATVSAGSYWGGAYEIELNWSIEISTNNFGGFINSGTTIIGSTDTFIRGVVQPGPQYPYTFAKIIDTLPGIIPSLPSEDLDINFIKWTLQVTSPDPAIYPFFRGSPISIASTRLTRALLDADGKTITSLEKPDSRFVRVEDPHGTPSFTSIVPPPSLYEGVPAQPYQIAPDWSDANILHAVGRSGENRWQHYRSTDKGDTWVSVLQSASWRWEKLNNDIELTGYINILDLRLGSNEIDRLGNMSELFELTSPNVGPAFVLFAGDSS